MDHEFESAVFDELIYTEVENIDGKEQAVVKANVTYSYALIKKAAEKVKSQEAFAARPKVMKLKFSDNWCKSWLGRCALRRRRITAVEKVLPEPEAVQVRIPPSSPQHCL